MSSPSMRVCVSLLVLSLAAFAICVRADVIERPKLGIENESQLESFTALQDYVSSPDSTYGWTRLPQFDETAQGYKVLWLNLTSQTWLTAADTDRSVWWHWMAIIVPSNLNPAFANRGLMYMTGGKQDDTPPKITSEDLIVGAVLAQTCETVVTVLFQIPNQPIVFHSEHPPRARNEDALIAYGWAQFLLHPDQPQWLARLPMTKAGVRAMDAATDFWHGVTGHTMSSWIVAGASKRGWTAWTVGACDPQRVVGIVPMVLDELNFVKNIHHHWRAYGGWSFALTDYVAANITTRFDSDEFALAMAIVDPIAYKEIITMPKLIISTGGDEFLMPDNTDYYWDELMGEKHFHQFPNLEHSMMENIPLVLDTVRGFVMAVQTGTPRPNYVWHKDLVTGAIHLEIDAANPPNNVQLWQAKTIDGPARRDFRLVAIMNNTSPPGKPFLHPVWWKAKDIEPTSSNATIIVYDINFAPPDDGSWIGFNIQMVFPGVNGTSFRVSTCTSIVPNTFPFEDCYMETCAGPLV